MILGFVRVTTRPGAFARPLTSEQAFETVDGWLSRSCVTVLHLLEQAGTAGNLTTDAHLAALALEYGATLCSSDNDFMRFGSQLRIFKPAL